MSQRPFVFMEEIESDTGLSDTTIWRMERADPPLFPKRIKLGVKKIAWVRAEYETWKAQRAAARSPAHAGCA